MHACMHAIWMGSVPQVNKVALFNFDIEEKKKMQIDRVGLVVVFAHMLACFLRVPNFPPLHAGKQVNEK